MRCVRRIGKRSKNAHRSDKESSSYASSCTDAQHNVVTFIAPPPEAEVDGDKSTQWGLRELANELGLRKETLNTWRRRGWVHATQESTRWTFWANEEELNRLRKLVDHNRQGLQKTPAELTTPTAKTI